VSSGLNLNQVGFSLVFYEVESSSTR